MADTNAPAALLAMPMPTRVSYPEMEMLGPLMRGRNHLPPRVWPAIARLVRLNSVGDSRELALLARTVGAADELVGAQHEQRVESIGLGRDVRLQKKSRLGRRLSKEARLGRPRHTWREHLGPTRG